MKDVVLSDGTRIPRGTMVAASAYAMHHDGALLADADTFDPFRFARVRGADDSESQGADVGGWVQQLVRRRGKVAWQTGS